MASRHCLPVLGRVAASRPKATLDVLRRLVNSRLRGLLVLGLFLLDRVAEVLDAFADAVNGLLVTSPASAAGAPAIRLSLYADPVVEAALHVQPLADPPRDARHGDDRLPQGSVRGCQNDREDQRLFALRPPDHRRRQLSYGPCRPLPRITVESKVPVAPVARRSNARPRSRPRHPRSRHRRRRTKTPAYVLASECADTGLRGAHQSSELQARGEVNRNAATPCSARPAAPARTRARGPR